tara:strand:- start:507 stop:2180 length:1674 start_codon:yes stop_codon:yes gene_type:complete
MAKGRDRGFIRKLFSGQFYDDVISDSDITAANIKYVRKDGNDGSGDGSTSSPYKTIAKAMSQSVDTRTYVTGTGDRFMIIVGPGEYNEVIDCRHPHGFGVTNLQGKPIGNLTVRGENFMSATIIDAHTTPHSTYPSLIYGHTSGSIFENLTFRHVTGTGQNDQLAHSAQDASINRINHAWYGPAVGGHTGYEGGNGYGYHSNIRFLYCEHSQSHGGRAHGVQLQTERPLDQARWPSRVDNCIFRGGGPGPATTEGHQNGSSDFTGIAINIGNHVDRGATSSFATNNIIYYYSIGIDNGGSYQAQVINNTILSCSTYGIKSHRASKIYNNIIVGINNGYGIQYGAAYDAEVEYNILTGSWTSDGAEGNTTDLRATNTTLTDSDSGWGTNQRIDPQLAATGNIDDRSEGINGTDTPFEVFQWDFAPASWIARCVDFGYDDKISSIGKSDVRGVLRESEKDRKVKPIQTLNGIDAGAVEFRVYQARGGPNGQSGQTMDGDFTINTYNNTSADVNRPAEDNDVGIEDRSPISLSVPGVPHLHVPTDARKPDAYRITLGNKS